MSKCDITVTMPIEEYERLKDNAESQNNRYRRLFNSLNKFVDVDEEGKATKVDVDGLLDFLITEIYEVKYDL